ncbi:MAG: hypothetical protein GY788_27915 [bacterium]|nr:hypothetical protein [bacterium]
MRDPADDQVFIIRCWNESGEACGRPSQWRMRVIYLNREQEAYFNEPAAIVDFIADNLADANKAGHDDAPKHPR